MVFWEGYIYPIYIKRWRGPDDIDPTGKSNDNRLDPVALRPAKRRMSLDWTSTVGQSNSGQERWEDGQYDFEEWENMVPLVSWVAYPTESSLWIEQSEHGPANEWPYEHRLTPNSISCREKIWARIEWTLEGRPGYGRKPGWWSWRFRKRKQFWSVYCGTLRPLATQIFRGRSDKDVILLTIYDQAKLPRAYI